MSTRNGSKSYWRVQVRVSPIERDAPPHPVHGEEWVTVRRDDGTLARFKTEHEAAMGQVRLEESQPHGLFRTLEVTAELSKRKRRI